MLKKQKRTECPTQSCGHNPSRKEDLDRIAASITAYYDSLTDAEVAEDRAWGEFAATQFPSEY